MNFKQIKRKYFKSTEEVISMFLGLVIVVVVGGLIFNYFQKNKGIISVPGSKDEVVLSGNVLNNKAGSYEVVRDDSLWKIAMKKYGNGYAWGEIAKANNLKNPSSLEVGQKLILPEKVIVEGKEIELANNTSVVVNNNSSITPGTDYKVAKGDSLWKIAVKAYGDGYQWAKIWQQNKVNLPNANGLEIGMVLNIPKLN